MDLVDYTIDQSTNSLVSGTISNAWIRIEDYVRKSDNEFYQLGTTIKQEFSDTFRATLIAGLSNSTADVPYETSIIFDDRDANGHSFDYSGDSRQPRLSFNNDITSPAAFQFAEFRDRPSNLVNKYRTLKLNTEWEAAEGFKILAGGLYRQFTFDLVGGSRDAAYCSAFTCAPGAYGAPVSAAMTRPYDLPDVGGVPAGTTTSFIVPDRDVVTDMIGLYDRPLNPSAGDIRNVRERAYSGFVQFNGEGTLLGLEYALNGGVRYVRTEQRSVGINNAQTIALERS
jgi:hypothetical protein